ncbi:MAG: M48 family metallopeptidase [Vulcanimicrobiaceae bacterium]
MLRKPMSSIKTVAALGLAAGLFALGISPVRADDQEQQIGAQVYKQLKDKGDIIARPDPLYAVLDPIAARIAKVADPQYQYPFHFILVHEAQPNAFAVPGGTVYVTDSLMKFVQNQEELAGVLCHETSHDIHHDVVNLDAKQQTEGAIIGILGALTGIGNSGLGQLGESVVYTLGSDHFSRAVESAADHKGAITCAQADFNPWGMVWLFERFQDTGEGGSMEMLSDHPSDGHRIADLEKEFHSDPQLFGRFSASKATATPLRVAKAAPAHPAAAESSSGRQTPAPAGTPDISLTQGN